MSKSIVRKALALDEQDHPLPERKSKGEQAKATKRSSKRTTGTALDLIPQHHRMVEFVGKKGHKQERELLRRREQLTVTEVRRRMANRKDNASENVKKLLLLSGTNLGAETSAKLLMRAQTGRYVTKVQIPKELRTEVRQDIAEEDEQMGGVFDEEDFAKFQQALEELGNA